MLQIRKQAGVTLLDYMALDERALIHICGVFGIAVSQEQDWRLAEVHPEFQTFPRRISAGQ